MELKKQNLSDLDFADKIDVIMDHLNTLKRNARSDPKPENYKRLKVNVFLGLLNEDEIGIITASRTQGRYDLLFMMLHQLRDNFTFSELSFICDIMNNLEQIGIEPLKNYEAFIKSCFCIDYVKQFLEQNKEEDSE